MKKNKYSPAPLFNRLIAYLIDWYISALIMFLAVSIVQSFANNELIITSSIDNINLFQSFIAFLLGLILVLLYFCYPLILNKYDGQTIGKHIMGLKVIRYDNNSLTIKDYILRYLVGLILVEENLNVCSFVLRSVLSQFVPHIIVEIIYYIGTILCIVSIVLVFTNKHKMLHDIISKTKVVRLENTK